VHVRPEERVRLGRGRRALELGHARGCKVRPRGGPPRGGTGFGAVAKMECRQRRRGAGTKIPGGGKRKRRKSRAGETFSAAGDGRCRGRDLGRPWRKTAFGVDLA
jgi:hypothetical protein